MQATRCRMHSPPGAAAREPAADRVLLLGQPNVGKSLLFNRLTGARTTVSNYPGTSVDVATGTADLADRRVTVLDTPGIYSLVPVTEDERVTRELVLAGDATLVHVIEARNLERSLPLTLQLRATGRPLVVALNMMDEAREQGLEIDGDLLSRRLGAPVVAVSAATGEGCDRLRRTIHGTATPRHSAAFEAFDGANLHNPGARPMHRGRAARAVERVSRQLRGWYPVDREVLAALLLEDDDGALARIRAGEPDGGRGAVAAVNETKGELASPTSYRLAVDRRRLADRIARGVVTDPDGEEAASPGSRGERLGRWLARPLTGIPVLLVVLYLGLYQFVGLFGAGTVVDWLEGIVFGVHLNPLLEEAFAGIPWEGVRSLFVGEYGLLTLGLRYAVAIILPLVGTFFLFFALLEDSGYLPRLSLLVDRGFKRIGLNGRAVIPMVLGFACDTMATMVTRTLETRRERVLSTVLLALAVPCSAQLGVILAVLAGHPAALAIWGLAVLGSFVLVGAVGARILPGTPATFHMELPPMRIPRPSNVIAKTASRVHWYFLEVLPLFLLASVLLWAGDHTGLLALTLDGLGPVVGALGLPAEAASVLLFGFFRRDYGAAGLFDLHGAGLLDPVQLTVAAVTLTLFVPCVAQFLMMWKERGWRTALATAAFASGFAISVGAGLNLALRGLAPWS